MDAQGAIAEAKRMPEPERRHFLESVYLALGELLRRGEPLEAAWRKATEAAWQARHGGRELARPGQPLL